MMEQTYNVGIYCRLSKDDGTDSVSMSIANQQQSLTEYVKERNWNLIDVYYDDGVSGTTFERSGFQRLINDIEIGRINCVITKDLSRLGRNYLQAGYYTENYFPEHNVRYIAVNDNYDSTQENDFAPFKNIINEWYAKDISKKIRFSYNQKFKEPKVLNPNKPLYGYAHDEEGNRMLDIETAPIVKKIFTEYINGKSSIMIAEMLKREHVYCPSYYQYIKYSILKSKYANVTDIDVKCNWTTSTILQILKNEEYLGHLIKHKTTRKSFKMRKNITVPEKDRYKFENIFPSIITEEEFVLTSKLLKENERASVPLSQNRYQGLLYCGCCGSVMKYHDKGDSRKYKYVYYCTNKKCNNRARIALERMDEVFQNEVENIVDVILQNEEEFLNFVKLYKENVQPKIEDYSEEISKLKIELNKINRKIGALFEAKLNDEIPISTYEKMMSTYKHQVLEIEDKIRRLESIPKQQIVDYVAEANEIVNILKNHEEDCYTKREFIVRFLQKAVITKKTDKDYSMKLSYISSKLIKEYELCQKKLQQFM